MSATQSTPLIELHDVRLRLSGRDVLDLEHMLVRRGQFQVLTGPNGAGKTTLLKLLAGLLRAQSGRFHCLGTPMSASDASRFCRGRHIYLHQTPYLFDGTVADNIAYGLKQRGRDSAQRSIEIRDALAWAQLEHLTDRPARELSTGERQRVALTRARILNPSLLLLDEITANMDSESRQRSLTMIADLKHAGSSVIYATHGEIEFREKVDVELVMRDGRLRGSGYSSAAVVPIRRDGGKVDKP